MLVLSFCHILHHEPLNAEFNLRNIDLTDETTWNPKYTGFSTWLIAQWMSKKAKYHSKPVENCTFNNKHIFLLTKWEPDRSPKHFLLFSIHSFASKYLRIRQAFRTTFFASKCSIMFRDSGTCIQRILVGTSKAISLYVDRIPTVLDGFMWVHFLNMVKNAIADNNVSN